MDWCCHWDLPSTALASPSPLQADPATLLDTPATPPLTNTDPVNEVRAGLTLAVPLRFEGAHNR